LEYDAGTSFFAVYDGHGGHEVATYTAQHLPQYLKNCEAYKQGDYAQALKDAFLEFDATLTTPDVLAVLKQIASSKDGGGRNSESGNYTCTKQGYCKCGVFVFESLQIATHYTFSMRRFDPFLMKFSVKMQFVRCATPWNTAEVFGSDLVYPNVSILCVKERYRK
jgi:hypothetical protein